MPQRFDGKENRTDFSSPYIKAGGWSGFRLGSKVLSSQLPIHLTPKQGVGGGPAQDRTPRTQELPGGSPGCAPPLRRLPVCPATNHRRVPPPLRHHTRRGLPAPSLPGKPRIRGLVTRVSGSLGDGGAGDSGGARPRHSFGGGRGRRPEDMNARGPQEPRDRRQLPSNTSCSDVTGHVGRGLKGAAGPDFPAPAR